MILRIVKGAINWKRKMGLAILLGLILGLLVAVNARVTYVTEKDYKTMTAKIDKNKAQVSKLSKEIENNTKLIEKYQSSPEAKKGK